MNLNSESFEAIYNQYKLLVYNVALQYVQNIEDAEEITQDVFVLVYKNLAQFKGNAALKTWIYRITINQSLDFLKYKNSKKRFFIFGKKADSLSQHEGIACFEHPGIAVENQENAALLFEAINQLPENQKSAFILSKIEGLGNAEIAEIMQCSISSIESLIFRAKKSLRENLEQKFENNRKK